MRRRGFRSARAKGDFVWSAVSTNLDTVVAGGTESLSVVQATDWTGAAGFEKATLMRVRGSVSFVQVTTVAALTSLRVGVVNVNAGETVPDLNAVTTFTDEDILWYSIHQGLATAAGDDVIHAPLVIDIKAKRKIDVNSNVLFLIRPTGNDFVYSAVLRALIKR